MKGLETKLQFHGLKNDAEQISLRSGPSSLSSYYEQASLIQLQGIQKLTKLEISGFGSGILTFPILGSHFWLC